MSAVAVSFGKRYKIANLTTFINLFIVSGICFLYFNVSDAIYIKNTFFSHLAQILFCLLYLQIVVFSETIENFNIPNWAVASGSNSYSLYVIHFPLLLLTYSITQNWMMDSYLKTGVVSIITLPSIYLFSLLFSSFFENQKLFKPAVRAFICWTKVDILRQK